MNLIALSQLLGLSTISAAPAAGPSEGKRVIPAGGIAPGTPVTPKTKPFIFEAQAALLYTDGSKTQIKPKYYFENLACPIPGTGELTEILGFRGDGSMGSYGVESARRIRWHQLARVFDALLTNVRNHDGSIDYDRLKAALSLRSSGSVTKKTNALDAINEDLLRDGALDGVTSNPNDFGNINNPKDAVLLGRVANTKLTFIDDYLTEESKKIVVEDALRMKVRAEQGVDVKVSTILKDNDPIGRIVDDVDSIVGEVKGFSLSWDHKANDLIVNGSVNWERGVVSEQDCKAKFEQLTRDLPNASSMDFNTTLIKELKARVIGYATLAVLKVASGGGDTIDLGIVRDRAYRAREQQIQGQ